MNENIEKIKKQKLEKLIIMFYNTIRMSIFKLLHPRSAKVSFIQNIHPSTEMKIDGGSLKLANSIFTRKYVSFRVTSGNLKIGTSFFNQGCTITAMKNIEIGNDCLFGPNVVIVDHDHDYKYPDNSRGLYYFMDDVIIGNNVWIGANSTILRGTFLPDNCVVAANSVVKGKFEKNTLILNERGIKVKLINMKRLNSNGITV